MSIIHVVACIGFVVSESDGPPTILFGADDVRRSPDTGKWVFRIGSTGAIERKRLPCPGLTLLYGHRNCLDQVLAMRLIIEGHRDLGRLHVATLSIEVDEIEKEKIGIDKLPLLRFCSIRRMKAEAQTALMQCLNKSLVSRGEKPISRVADIALHTVLIGEALESPPFHTLEVFVYPALNHVGKIDHFAYLKPSAKIVEIEQNTEKSWIAEVPGMTMGGKNSHSESAVFQPGEVA